MLCRCLRWHVGLEWYAAALFIPVVIALTAIFLMVLFGGDTSPTEQINLGQINWHSLILLFPVAMIDAPLARNQLGVATLCPGSPPAVHLFRTL